VPVASHHKAAMDDWLKTMDYHLIPTHGDIALTVIYMKKESTLLTIFESLLQYEV
jgi:hypothetical protein